MKRSLSLACISLVAAATAFAINPKLEKQESTLQLYKYKVESQVSSRNADKVKRSRKPASSTKFEKTADAEKVTTRISQMRRVNRAQDQDIKSIEGDWIFTLGDYYLEDFGEPVMSYETQYKATIYDGDLVVFEAVEPVRFELPLMANYNEETQNLEFPTRIIAQKPYFLWYTYVYQEPFAYNEETETLEYGTIEAKYDAAAGTITFDPENGVEWTSYEDDKMQEFLWTEFIVDLEGAVRGNISENDDVNWQDFGVATFVDGWVLPGLGINQFDRNNWYEVDVQQHIMNTNRYRLVDPYHSGPAAKYNSSTEKGYIVFDVTDPNHVLVNPNLVAAGFANEDLGLSRIYCYNMLQYYVNATGYPAATIVEAMGEDMAYTTYKDNLVTLAGYLDKEYGYIYDANFGTPDVREGGYAWPNENGDSLDMTTYIFMPGADLDGIEDVMIDANDATTTFYNLNGIKVDRPGKGIYVVKSGNKVRKVILK